MSELNDSKSTPIEPYINCDGWWTQCKTCWNEIYPHNDICPYCNQVQDWSWLKYKK